MYVPTDIFVYPTCIEPGSVQEANVRTVCLVGISLFSSQDPYSDYVGYVSLLESFRNSSSSRQMTSLSHITPRTGFWA